MTTSRSLTPLESFIHNLCRIYIDADERREGGMTRAQVSYATQMWSVAWFAMNDTGRDSYLPLRNSIQAAIVAYHVENKLQSPI